MDGGKACGDHVLRREAPIFPVASVRDIYNEAIGNLVEFIYGFPTFKMKHSREVRVKGSENTGEWIRRKGDTLHTYCCNLTILYIQCGVGYDSQGQLLWGHPYY